MSYQYKGFIPQNIAPKGATQIGVYDKNGNRVCGIPLGHLTRPQGEMLYSFGLVSDIHIEGSLNTQATPTEHLEQALVFFKENGCAFCAHAGDITNIGFWSSASATDMHLSQFAEYKRIIESHADLPVYGITGNHDSYYKSITNNFGELEAYTGHGLYYDIVYGNDVFIFVGQPANSNPTMNEEEYLWVKGLLEANTDKRCHVFTHFFVAGDSGSTNNCYTCNFGGYETAFKDMMQQHGKAIHYHGHSHIKFKYQELDENTVYTDKNGFPSVHIPSVSHSMDVVWNTEQNAYKREVDYSSSQGYIVDVYDDCLVFNGFAFNGGTPEPTGTFCVAIKGEVTQ